MRVVLFSCILLFTPFVLAELAQARGAPHVVEPEAKEAEHEAVEKPEMEGIKISKIEKTEEECDLKDCEEITGKCGWCAISAVDSSKGFGLKYEKEVDTVRRACPGEISLFPGFVPLCDATRAIITVTDDCPGQYTFFKEDCPKNGLVPFKPKTIPGTAENAPLVLPFLADSG